jgi:hypothetical protein
MLRTAGKGALAALIGGTLHASRPLTPVSAQEDWCTVDPAIPLGPRLGVPVHLLTGGPTSRRSDMMRVKEFYKGFQVENGFTYISLILVYPDSRNVPERLASEIWTGPNGTGTLLSRSTGLFGSPIRHNFVI